MSEGTRRAFPQYLSNPIQVLWFESDELSIIVLFFVLAMIYGGLAWILFFAGPYLYSRSKKTKPRGYLFHLLYMIGLNKMKHYPEYFDKDFNE
ncbi:hypothetical protein GF1_16260 [Desulfolithobacter dissulfuricans]|uniref:Type IV conjugative transfer system protein TraL n=1 Tax=Desulfolithobacter dissulfuricans TaxID=2795293 RepID=A0A915XIJ9_9BACT|nr:type IV conjugative transfer system protein TraL [Desulfolithobacter dissulfuricans]BCO09250.1 hypothetical protein GF1_16260 [Desulfolithobacter dissulfuricans]